MKRLTLNILLFLAILVTGSGILSYFLYGEFRFMVHWAAFAAALGGLFTRHRLQNGSDLDQRNS